ncbi:MAG: polyprenyl synthetase family protein [Chloracidobacterium sp.]|nr:polyprenyl synthetase family protein [Chloracidobacterium sp.]
MLDVSTVVDKALDDLLPVADTEPARLHEAMRWSMFAGGKRIRPGILFAAGRTFGADEQMLVRTAVAIEMIHTYSLIHDDLPAMDDDDLRRGRETCHKKFDEATAILAGDALLAQAFEVVACDENLSPELRLKLVSQIANASGTPRGMVAGQQLDLEAEGQTINIEELENIHARKTGALITVSAMAGAMIAGANSAEVAAVELYASKIGLLFQITDDLLDVTQATETLGKTAGKDAIAEKATYPGHFGIEATREMADKVRGEAADALGTIDRDTALLLEFADLIAGRSK